jgi:protein O-GlcNAc transferase
MKSRQELFEEAERLEESGREQEALRIWKALSENFPDVDVLSRLGLLAKKVGELEVAKLAFSSLIGLDPSAEAAHLALGSIAIDEKEYEVAEVYLRTALGLESTRAGFSLLGVVLRHLRRDAEAEESYRQAIALDPQFDEAYFNLGVLLRETNPQEAEALFRKALELDPDYSPAHRELGWACRKGERLAEAERHVRRAIELQPDDGWAHIYLGNILWRKRDVRGARSEFKWAHEAVPDWAVPLWCLANLQENRGNWAKAESLYERAIEIQPDDVVANMNFGRMLAKKGDRDRAAVFLKRALLLKPDYKRATKLLDEIERARE